jgi:hypothetical protein
MEVSNHQGQGAGKPSEKALMGEVQGNAPSIGEKSGTQMKQCDV